MNFFKKLLGIYNYSDNNLKIKRNKILFQCTYCKDGAIECSRDATTETRLALACNKCSTKGYYVIREIQKSSKKMFGFYQVQSEGTLKFIGGVRKD